MDSVTLAAQQDDMRPFRQFISLLSGIVGEQSMASEDNWSGNYPYGYQSVGPYGVAIEGAPISTTRGGGLVVSPMLVMIGVGALAATFFMKK